MGKLAPPEGETILALEAIPGNTGVKAVKRRLRKYGRIVDVQFWTSGNGKRHGFVTFNDPLDAANCLEHASDEAPVLPIKPVNPVNFHRYRTPRRLSHVTSESPIQSSDEDSPSSWTRNSLPNEFDNPYAQPYIQGGTSFSGNGAGEEMQASTFAKAWNDALQVTNRLLTGSNALQIGPTTSESLLPARPINPSDIPRIHASGLPARPAYTEQAKEIDHLKLENANLRSNMQANAIASQRQKEENANLLRDLEEKHKEIEQYKVDREIRSKDIERRIQEVKFYKSERDRLVSDVAKISEDAGFYKKESQRFAADLDRESEIHRKQESAMRKDHADELARQADVHRKRETDLQGHLRRAANEVSRLRKELADQAQRTLDLEQKQQKIALPAPSNLPPQSRFSNSKGDTHQARNFSEPEEGQLPSDQPTSINPPRLPAPSLSHRNAVIPYLEKAFISLDEILTDALRHVEQAHDQEGPNKRQKRLEDA